MSSGRRSKAAGKSQIPESDAESSIPTSVPKVAEPKKGRKTQKMGSIFSAAVVDQNLPQSNNTELSKLRSGGQATKDNIGTSLPVLPNPLAEPDVEQLTREEIEMPPPQPLKGSKSKGRGKSKRNNTTSRGMTETEQAKADDDSQKAADESSKQRDTEMSNRHELSLPLPGPSQLMGRQTEATGDPKSKKNMSQSLNEASKAATSSQELTQKNPNFKEIQSFTFGQGSVSKYGIGGIHEEPINDSLLAKQTEVDSCCLEQDKNSNTSQSPRSNNSQAQGRRTTCYNWYRNMKEKSIEEETTAAADSPGFNSFNPNPPQCNTQQAQDPASPRFFTFNSNPPQTNTSKDPGSSGSGFNSFNTSPPQRNMPAAASTRFWTFNPNPPQSNMPQAQTSSGSGFNSFNPNPPQHNMPADASTRFWTFNPNPPQSNIPQPQTSSGTGFSFNSFNPNPPRRKKQQNQASARFFTFNSNPPQSSIPKAQTSSGTSFNSFNPNPPQRNAPQKPESTRFFSFNSNPPQRSKPQDQESSGSGFRWFNSSHPQKPPIEDSSSEEDEEEEETSSRAGYSGFNPINYEPSLTEPGHGGSQRQRSKRDESAAAMKERQRLKENFPGSPKGPLMYTCPFCPDVFSRTQDSNDHIIKFHKMVGDPPVYCTECGRGFLYEALYQVHRANAHPDKTEDNPGQIPKEPFLYKCPICSELFHRTVDSNTHILKFHKVDVDSPSYCAVCGHGFLYEAMYQLHYKSAHPEKGPELPAGIPATAAAPDVDANSSSDDSFVHIQSHRKRKGGAPNSDIFDTSSISLPEEEPSLVVLDESSSTNQSDDQPTPTTERSKLREVERVTSPERTTASTSKGNGIGPTSEQIQSPNQRKTNSPKTPRQERMPKSNVTSGQRDGHIWKVGTVEFPIVEYNGPKKDDKYTYVASPAPIPKGVAQTFKHPRRKCSVCFKSLSVSYYKTHKNQHTAPLDQAVTCPDCGKDYGNKKLLKQHKERVHDFKMNSTCQVCGRNFYRRGEQQRHISVQHDLIRFVCMGCSKVYNFKDGLQAHNRSAHSSNAPNSKNPTSPLPQKNKSGPIALDPPEAASTSRATIAVPRVNTRKTQARFVVSPRKSFPVRAKQASKKPENEVPVPRSQKQNGVPAVESSGKTSKMSIRSQADTSANTVVLEKTLNKSYVGIRKRCSNCGKDYAASYVNRHKVRAHAGPDRGPTQQGSKSKPTEESRNKNQANDVAVSTSTTSVSDQFARTRSSRKTIQTMI